MYRLLHVEADASAHAAVLAALAEGPLRFAVTQVADPDELAPPLADAAVDALLIGVRDRSSLTPHVARCRRSFPTEPLIVLTERSDLAFAQEALRAGAQDVVQRHERALAVLSRILLYAIERAGAEARGRQAAAAAAARDAVLDALFAGTTEAVLETDAVGTIRRASPAAAALLGISLPAAPGDHLAERIEAPARGRLGAFVAAAGEAATAASFGFRHGPEQRLLELQPLRLAPQASDAAAGVRLFRLSELAAAFAEDPEPATDRPGVAAAQAAVTAPAGSRRAEPPRAQPATPRPKAQPAAALAGEHDAGGEPEPEATLAAAPAASPLEQLQAIAAVTQWRTTTTVGGDDALGFLVADAESAQALQRLAATAREDFDFALALDQARLKAWQDMARRTGELPAARPVLEISYGTVASRPHFERLLAELEAAPAGLAERFLLMLQGVPKGIYVPTLGKAIRSIGVSHGKPGLHVPDLDTDYRNLVLGHLAMLGIAVDDLKRALARDGNQVAALLARARGEGCRTIVRGATGALAEALRQRLGIDLTAPA